MEYLATTHFGAFGHSAPVFLSSGNHEEEEGWNLDDTYSRGVADIQAREAFFPTPVDNGAGYSGRRWYSMPSTWSLTPFDGDWPSSIFMSMDPVAIDSVAFDFLSQQWPELVLQYEGV